MTEEKQNNNQLSTAEAVSASAVVPEITNAPINNPIKESLGKLELYFANGRKLLTMPGGILSVNDDTRRLLALFSDGSFLVADSHKFDGRVLSFEVLARKKKVAIAKPVYLSQNEINAIYNYAERNNVDIEGDEDLDALQMQKDFVNVVARAAEKKVSDIHVVVADSTQIMFRVNGMMAIEMEYNKDWGESFVRAAFASADISDATMNCQVSTQEHLQGIVIWATQRVCKNTEATV